MSLTRPTIKESPRFFSSGATAAGTFLVVAAGALASTGTTNAMVGETLHADTPPPVWARQIWTGGGVASENPANEATEQDQGSQVMEVRRRTGLTWEKLGELFGVDRRSVHFWASGRPMNAAHREKLGRVLALVRRLPEDSRMVRAWLLSPDGDARLPFDLLRDGQHDKLVIPSAETIPFERPKVSPEVLRARAPRPPEELVGALHESVHHERTRLRAAIPLKKRT